MKKLSKRFKKLFREQTKARVKKDYIPESLESLKVEGKKNLEYVPEELEIRESEVEVEEGWESEFGERTLESGTDNVLKVTKKDEEEFIKKWEKERKKRTT